MSQLQPGSGKFVAGWVLPIEGRSPGQDLLVGLTLMALVVGVEVLVMVHGKSAVMRRIGRRPSVFEVGTATRPACRLGP